MKKLFFFLLVLIPLSGFAQSFQVTKSWVEYDVVEDNEEGMYFHYDLTIKNYKDDNLLLVMYVNDGDAMMKSYHKNYMTMQGYLRSSKTVTPKYDNCHWKDFKLFIPYSAMAFYESGKNYRYILSLFGHDSSYIDNSGYYSFDWKDYSPMAEVDSLWVEHNYKQNNKKGMLIHANIIIGNMDGSKADFSCYFYDSKQKKVMASKNSEGYANASNQLFTHKTVSINNKKSRWNDVKLFIPYSAFPQQTGLVRYYFRLKVRNVEMGNRTMASSQPIIFDLKDNKYANCGKPKIEFISDSITNKANYAVTVGIMSKSKITKTNISVNGSKSRGMKTVRNDGYQMKLKETVNLHEGVNEIEVSVANGCGVTKKKYQVTCDRSVAANVITDKRVALVIGNADYVEHPLSNPVNDANDIADSLKNLGFDVKMLVNVTKRQMDNAISELRERSDNHSVALFYYAGHGIQINGRNYLVPVDAELKDAADVEYTCTDVNRVLSNLETSGCMMNIIVLDACRDNPFEQSWSRGLGSHGLSTINAPKGTFIAYATSPGDVALDGNGRNSPYAEAFLKTLSIPDLGLFDFFQQIQLDVMLKTDDAQIPWVSSSFVGKFFFNQK